MKLKERGTMQKIHKILLSIRAVPKTLYFNLKYFPFNIAFKLPVIISHRVALQEMKGIVELKQSAKFNMVRIGFHENPTFDRRRTRAVWNNLGKVVFDGTAYLGNGSCIANFGGLKIWK